MPFVDNQGIRIHYELRGDGPPLVLLHGFSGNLGRWSSLGYTDQLAEKYKLVLIDARGHGQSDKPHHADAYTWDQRSSDVIAVLDDAKLAQAHLFGFSLGGIYAFHLAALIPQRILSLIAWAAHPYASTFNAFAEVDGINPDAFLFALEQYLGEAITPAGKRLIVEENDLPTLVAAATDRDSLAQSFSVMSMPILVMAGSKDARYQLMEKCVHELPGATFVSLDGYGHMQSKVPSDLILKHVFSFLNVHG